MKRSISVIIACCIVVTALLPAITASAEADDNVNQAICNFCSDLFKRTYQDGNTGRNMIVSPLSLYADVAMLDNGAVNNTQSEILSMLQSGDSTLTQDVLNEYFKQYMDYIANDNTVNMADSVYISDREDIRINQDFVKTAETFYNAEVFTAPPNESTISRINKWASKNTNGAVKKVVDSDSINDDTNSVLLNAVAFYGEWEDKFTESQIGTHTFTNYDGSTYEANVLYDTLDEYYQDDMAIAFARPYKGDYEFIAILPNEDVGIDKYIESIDGSTINNLLKDVYSVDAHIMIPKFEFNNELFFNDTLKGMGMKDAFNRVNADFSNLAPSTDDDTNVFVDNVKQLTHVRLDENGTIAEAVTAIEMQLWPTGAMHEDVDIYLDRPFIFLIYDTKNSRPLFMGTVCELNESINNISGVQADGFMNMDNNLILKIVLISAAVIICVICVFVIIKRKKRSKINPKTT